MKNKKKEPSLIDEYKEMRPIYEACTKKYESLIRDLIEEAEIPIHSISKRTKTISSFSSKLTNETEKYRKLSDMTDLSGIRICCYFSSQIEELASLIKKNFIVIPELSVDKRETMEPDRFGYSSLHYVVKLSEKRSNLPEFKKYKDLFCEIQMRTVLQHAWAEIEHDLGYKSEIEVPKNIRRQFSRLAGLLELADEQFDNIKLQLEDYSSEIKTKIISKPKEVSIDNISIMSFMVTFSIIQNLDEKIAEIGRTELSNEFMTERIVKISNYFKIKSIKELVNILKIEKNNIIKFSQKLVDVYSPIGHEFDRGISLFFLGYILCSKSKNLEDIKKYIKTAISPSINPDRLDNWSSNILKIATEIF